MALRLPCQTAAVVANELVIVVPAAVALAVIAAVASYLRHRSKDS